MIVPGSHAFQRSCHAPKHALAHAGPALPGGYTQTCMHLKYLCRSTPGEHAAYSMLNQSMQEQWALLWQPAHSSRLFKLQIVRRHSLCAGRQVSSTHYTCLRESKYGYILCLSSVLMV